MAALSVHDSPGAWTRRRTAWTLAAITLFALVVRMVGIDFLLPHVWEPDQRVYTTQVELLRNGDPHPERNVNFGWYPLLPAYVVALAGSSQLGAPPSTLAEHLEAAGAPRLQIRRFLAALSVLVVPATYWIARRFGRRETALLAALIAAASVFHIWFAQQTRPHGLATATTALALVGALLVQRRGDALAYLAAGALLGIAASVLQSGLAVLPALLVAHVLCDRGRFWTRTGLLVVCLAITALALRVFYPFVFLPSAGPGADAAQFGVVEGSFNLSGHRVGFNQFGLGGFRVLFEAWCDYDVIVLVLASLGILTGVSMAARKLGSSPTRGSWAAVIRAHASLIVVLAFALPYLLVFGSYGATYPRFSLAFLPLLAVVAAWFVMEAPISRWARGLALVACCAQVVLAMRLAFIRTEPDTATQAAAWIASNVDRETERIAVQPGTDLPLFRDARSRGAFPPIIGMHNYPWLNYQVAVAENVPLEPGWQVENFPILRPTSRKLLAEDPASWVRSLGVDWFVVARGLEGASEDLGRAGRAISTHCTLAGRFTPLAFDAGDECPFVHQNDLQVDKASVWLRLPIAQRMGPVIEIWRAPSASTATDPSPSQR